ncbi:thymidylate kinase [Spirochaetia bacterium]|nr:thymidylate kinase [Spirochaetia bacterium]
MKKHMIHNFVVFEGGDGSGTTTQLDLLHRRFEKPGGGDVPAPGSRPLPPLYPTFEPTDGPIGRLIRSGLKGETKLQGETLARLFAADRGEHLNAKGGILERAGRGELVVSDRYVPSSLVYQGIECGDELPEALNSKFPVPELILFFDLDPEIARQRIKDRPEFEIYEYLEFQIKVRDRYRALLPLFRSQGSRVEIIDASKPPAEVAEEVWSAIKKMPIILNNG